MVDRVEHESFMLACLKMARSYVNIVAQELALYSSRPGHQPLELNFSKLKKSIDERVTLHTSRLERARTPSSNPKAAPSAVKRPKLKKRVVS